MKIGKNMIYIHQENGFWDREEILPDSYQIGTITDYENGAYVLLSDEQTAFHVAHPEASQMEVYNMQLTPEPVRSYEQAIQEKLTQIDMYDRSDSVNSFFVNNIPAWLTPDIRANYKNSIEAAELLGETHITFIIAGIVSTSTLQDARVMLAKIQRYADNCTIVTETHKANVRALTGATVEEIDAYDNTAGYPEKEFFTITQNVEGETV